MQTCILPSWCLCHSLSLASVKSRLVLPFCYQLTRVVLEKGPLNVCVCYKPLDLRTSEWMARGYGVTLMSRDWRIRRLTPLFSRWGNCRTFCQKFDGALIRRSLWKGKIFFRKRDNRPTFWWKIHKSVFTHFGGSVADSLYKFHLRASLALLSFARWRRYRADSALLWRMT